MYFEYERVCVCVRVCDIHFKFGNSYFIPRSHSRGSTKTEKKKNGAPNYNYVKKRFSSNTITLYDLMNFTHHQSQRKENYSVIIVTLLHVQLAVIDILSTISYSVS